jgi:aminobenzoyl-glutamate transport protein
LSQDAARPPSRPRPTLVERALDAIERVGNKLPDPAVLFFLMLLLTWVASGLLAPVAFDERHPATGEPIRVVNQLTGPALADFLSNMVTTFTGFHPLGVVLVALLGVGVAEKTGLVDAGLKQLMNLTPAKLLTPMLILIAIVSHTAADAGYVLVIPLGGALFYAAGRHPLAGIAAAFAGVSGGFAANFIPSGIDPLLQGFTQSAAQIVDPGRMVNPLCNLLFTGLSSIPIVLLGWFLTDRVIEPRLARTEIDGDPDEMPHIEPLSTRERRALLIALSSGIVTSVVFTIWAVLPGTALADADGDLTSFAAPLMQSLVPLIMIFFLVPGVVYGYAAGTVKTHRDIIKGMSDAMSTMGYYLVMAFFAALFIDAFGKSNVGVLIAVKGANALQELGLPASIKVVGVIGLTAGVNLLVGSASAKWALLSPIFVPMLMQLGISPELTQAAYRVGDSTTNIITPLMPYFPLVVVFCKRYVKGTGIGTVVALMLPYSIVFLVAWALFLLGYWALGIPLGLQATYVHP